MYSVLFFNMAERPGFEPGVELPPQQFSRLPPSATRPPLRLLQFGVLSSERGEDRQSAVFAFVIPNSQLRTPNYLVRSLSKKFVRTSRLSASSTPGVIRYVWFSLPSRTTSYTEPSAPALGSLQPYTSLPILASTS